MKNFRVFLVWVLAFHFIYGANIDVISREEGSGTRGAFVELFDIQKVNKKGKKIDHTTQRAEITNSTSVVLSTVSGNKNAIGYISLGSLSDKVKPLQINGAMPNAHNIKEKLYPIARPFNIATNGKTSAIVQDFINFILSKEGQAIVDKKGYISLDSTTNFKSNQASGKITISGSSSVTPVMEALKEAYINLNPRANIQLQQSDSTIGISSVIQGISDIGMVSRDLKQSEKDKGIVAEVIAMDGIVVIINKQNPIENLSKEQVREIYLGNIKNWEDLH